MTEKTIQTDIFREANTHPGTRLFRNNIGTGWVGVLVRKTTEFITLKFPRPVKFGLHIGSGDLIGWHSITITEQHVGKKIAVFLSVEVKNPTGKPTADQLNWAQQIKLAGGISGIARSVADYNTIINSVI